MSLDALTQTQAGAIARLREEVAAASRLLVMENLLDYSGHVSARVVRRMIYRRGRQRRRRLRLGLRRHAGHDKSHHRKCHRTPTHNGAHTRVLPG